jgi:hypothetical protein
MVMNWNDAALGMAGVIGCGVAVVHGVLTQRLMVGPFEQLADRRIAAPIRRLVPLLLQFSTFNWFVGGLALIVAANSFTTTVVPSSMRPRWEPSVRSQLYGVAYVRFRTLSASLQRVRSQLAGTLKTIQWAKNPS